MHRVLRLVGLCLIPVMTGEGAAWAQGRGGGGNWPTAGSDPQRTSWVRADAKISKDSLQKPGFQLLWKSKLDNETKQLLSLTQPLLLQNIISYKGFKALAFVGGSADNVYSIDYDLNKPFWKVHLSSGVTTPGTAACPAALTTITRAATVVAPAAGGRGGRGAAPAAGAANPAAPVAPGASPAGRRPAAPVGIARHAAGRRRRAGADTARRDTSRRGARRRAAAGRAAGRRRRRRWWRWRRLRRRQQQRLSRSRAVAWSTC